MNAVFVQFSLDDRVIVPENEGIFWSFVLEDTEFGIYLVLHVVSVTVQVVMRNVH